MSVSARTPSVGAWILEQIHRPSYVNLVHMYTKNPHTSWFVFAINTEGVRLMKWEHGNDFVVCVLGPQGFSFEDVPGNRSTHKSSRH